MIIIIILLAIIAATLLFGPQITLGALAIIGIIVGVLWAHYNIFN